MIAINVSHSSRTVRDIFFPAMQPQSRSRQCLHIGTLVQGAIVVGVGIYAMVVLFYWLFTN